MTNQSEKSFYYHMRVNYVESTGQKNLIKCTFDIYEKLGKKKEKNYITQVCRYANAAFFVYFSFLSNRPLEGCFGLF